MHAEDKHLVWSHPQPDYCPGMHSRALSVNFLFFYVYNLKDFIACTCVFFLGKKPRYNVL